METTADEVCYSSAMAENSEERETSPVCYRGARTQHEQPWKRSFIYLQCYFLTVATILGTGILGLPVTIARSGPIPFLVSFVIGFFMQALLIYLFVDLLQRCRVAQMESVKPLEPERILMQNVSPVSDNEDIEEMEDIEDAGRILITSMNVVSHIEAV